MVMWDFLPGFPKLDTNFAVIILNQPIQCETELIKWLWSKAVVRALVDGGSNQWLNYLEENKISDLKLPDFISGDFDSITPKTRAYFEAQKVEFIHTPDQDETDFTKAIRCLKNVLNKRNLNIKFVLAVCENSGRLDQVISNINTLSLSYKEILPDIPVIKLSRHCMTWVLRSGSHTILVSEDFVQEQYPCGLLPFCGPTLVTTSGLKWNLENQTMEMGGLISTSNTFAMKEVNVSCNRDLVWTTQYSKIDHQKK